MELNIHNYEAWLLDHLEGRLTGDQLGLLKAFAIAHPELEIDLAEYDLPVVEPQGEEISTSFLRKDLPTAEEHRVLEYLEGLMNERDERSFEKQLASDISLRGLKDDFMATRLSPGHETFANDLLYKDCPTQDDERVLQYREGLLNERESRAFEQGLSEDSRLREIDRQFAACTLRPDLQVVFENKEALLKEAKVIGMWGVTLRAAAAVILLAMLAVLFWPESPVSANADLAEKSTDHTSESVKTIQRTVQEQAMPEVQPESVKTIAQRSVPKGSVKTFSATEQSPVQGDIPKKNRNKHIAHSTSPEISEIQPTVLAETDTHTDTVQHHQDKPAETFIVITNLESLPVADISPEYPEKKGFWERAAHVVQQFDKMGIKGIKASREGKSVSLSFNELEIEKKYARL